MRFAVAHLSPRPPLRYAAVRRQPARMRGFSLIEVSIVTAIVLLIAIIGVPAVDSYVIENKVPRVAEELQRFILRLKVGAQGAGPVPYAGVDGLLLAEALRSSSVLSVDGNRSSSTVGHGLGGTGKGSSGVVTLAPIESGGAFTLSLSNVNRAACPALPSIMQRLAESVRIESGAGAAVVKDDRAGKPVAYSAVAAQNLCAPGDSNLFVFTFR